MIGDDVCGAEPHVITPGQFSGILLSCGVLSMSMKPALTLTAIIFWARRLFTSLVYQKHWCQYQWSHSTFSYASWGWLLFDTFFLLLADVSSGLTIIMILYLDDQRCRSDSHANLPSKAVILRQLLFQSKCQKAAACYKSNWTSRNDVWRQPTTVGTKQNISWRYVLAAGSGSLGHELSFRFHYQESSSNVGSSFTVSD